MSLKLGCRITEKLDLRISEYENITGLSRGDIIRSAINDYLNDRLSKEVPIEPVKAPEPKKVPIEPVKAPEPKKVPIEPVKAPEPKKVPIEPVKNENQDLYDAFGLNHPSNEKRKKARASRKKKRK